MTTQELASTTGEIPALDPIRLLHRGDGSIVGFTGNNDGFHNVGAFEITDLPRALPALQPWLKNDSYFTVNGLQRLAPYKNRLTGYPDVWRKEKNIQYLNACYVDLDCGRRAGTVAQRMSWREVAARLGDLMDENVLPQMSLFARSGRGIYVLWLLRDEHDASQPLTCCQANLNLYKEINKAIGGLLGELAADLKAFDAARVLRVPGTLHSKTHQPATYTMQFDAEGHNYTYTLVHLYAGRVGLMVRCAR